MQHSSAVFRNTLGFEFSFGYRVFRRIYTKSYFALFSFTER